MDAVIPTEIGLPTIRTEVGRQGDANMELGRNLDWADEVRESASIRMADYQQRAATHYNRKARPRFLRLRNRFVRSVGRGLGGRKRKIGNGRHHLESLHNGLLLLLFCGRRADRGERVAPLLTRRFP